MEARTSLPSPFRSCSAKADLPSASRCQQVCYLCRKRVGACIQCANRNCFTAFHVTCARDHGLELKMKQGNSNGELKAYCEKHSEVGCFPFAYTHPGGVRRAGDDEDWRADRCCPRSQDTAAVEARKAARQASGQTSLRVTLNGHGGILKSAKSSRAYKKSYSSGPPLIPSYVLDRVNQYTSKLKVVNKKDFMNLLCRYWSLKREARRGAPLLKRLHLEVSRSFSALTLSVELTLGFAPFTALDRLRHIPPPNRAREGQEARADAPRPQ